MLKLKVGAATLFFTVSVAVGVGAAWAGGPAQGKAKTTEKADPKVSKSPLSEQEILAKYSYEQLDMAATYLVAVTESYQQTKGRKAILACDPSKAKGDMMLSGPLRYLLDQKRPSEVSAYEAWLGQAKEEGDKWAGCASTCTCATYLAVVNEANVPKGKEKIHAQISERLSRENAKQDTARTAQCASRQTWICGSPLLQYLKSEVK